MNDMHLLCMECMAFMVTKTGTVNDMHFAAMNERLHTTHEHTTSADLHAAIDLQGGAIWNAPSRGGVAAAVVDPEAA